MKMNPEGKEFTTKLIALMNDTQFCAGAVVSIAQDIPGKGLVCTDFIIAKENAPIEAMRDSLEISFEDRLTINEYH